jgi:acyl-coenzyme A synthetase/AMP-(fatty) acid ligase
MAAPPSGPGDQVRADEQGLLYFVGREDAMIKTSGNRVSPTEVEEAAVASGLVAEAVRSAIPTTGWARRSRWSSGRRRDGGGEAELRNYLKRELPNFMQPSAILWRDELPRAPTASSTAKR